MEPRFYIPEIEEFHVGFEYEEYSSFDREWNKKIFPLLERLTHINLSIESGRIRVRHLCHEDIVAEGWELFNPKLEKEYRLIVSDEIRFSLSTIFYPIIGIFRFSKLNNDTLEPFVKDGVFHGTIRNRSELRRVMKMVGIEK